MHKLILFTQAQFWTFHKKIYLVVIHSIVQKRAKKERNNPMETTPGLQSLKVLAAADNKKVFVHVYNALSGF